jgi:membrane peptidoglycan carboxypeptidase
MDATAKMNEMLINVVDNGTGKRARMGYPVAGKTGTSQNSRDAWFIGYTGNIIAGVWVGNDDNTPMKKVGGGGLPAEIWHDFMQVASAERDVGELPTSEDNVSDEESSSTEEHEGIYKKRRESIWDSIIRGFGGRSDEDTTRDREIIKNTHESNSIESEPNSEEVIFGHENEGEHNVDVEYKYPGSGR